MHHRIDMTGKNSEWFSSEKTYPLAGEHASKKLSLLGKGSFAAVYRMCCDTVYYAVKSLKMGKI